MVQHFHRFVLESIPIVRLSNGSVAHRIDVIQFDFVSVFFFLLVRTIEEINVRVVNSHRIDIRQHNRRQFVRCIRLIGRKAHFPNIYSIHRIQFRCWLHWFLSQSHAWYVNLIDCGCTHIHTRATNKFIVICLQWKLNGVRSWKHNRIQLPTFGNSHEYWEPVSLQRFINHLMIDWFTCWQCISRSTVSAAHFINFYR